MLNQGCSKSLYTSSLETENFLSFMIKMYLLLIRLACGVICMGLDSVEVDIESTDGEPGSFSSKEMETSFITSEVKSDKVPSRSSSRKAFIIPSTSDGV